MAQTKKKRSPAALKVMLWKADNFGIASRIAREMDPPVSPQFVCQILSGERAGNKPVGASVLAALRAAGAPIPKVAKGASPRSSPGPSSPDPCSVGTPTGEPGNP